MSTDGAAVMLGKKKELKARLLQVVPHFTHCIVHWEAPASKMLNTELKKCFWDHYKNCQLHNIMSTQNQSLQWTEIRASGPAVPHRSQVGFTWKRSQLPVWTVGQGAFIFWWRMSPSWTIKSAHSRGKWIDGLCESKWDWYISWAGGIHGH